MEKINEEIKAMNDLLTSSDAEMSNGIDLKLLSDIKDIFRQHVNDRRNGDPEELVLDEETIKKLKDTKELTFDVLQKFRVLNSSVHSRKKAEGGEKFSDLDELNGYISSQQEIINSELWKIDTLLDCFLEK